jgi:hypothetical protein
VLAAMKQVDEALNPHCFNFSESLNSSSLHTIKRFIAITFEENDHCCYFFNKIHRLTLKFAHLWKKAPWGKLASVIWEKRKKG